MLDEELRLKAAEISINAAATMLCSPMIGSLTEIDFFGLCDPIIEYVKTGKKLAPVRPKR